MANLIRALTFVLAALTVHASIILENTIPSGNLFLQPPVVTGAAPIFGPTVQGVVVADAFTAPTTASLDSVSVAVDYPNLAALGVTGTSPMLLTLLSNNGNSPGAPIESWTVPLSPADTSLTVVSVNSVIHPLLMAGQQYWLSVVPTDPVHTGIGWGLASSGPPGIELPIAESITGQNSGWMPTTLNLANEFSVLGTPSVIGTAVPEPAPFGICAFVLGSLILWRRRRVQGCCC